MVPLGSKNQRPFSRGEFWMDQVAMPQGMPTSGRVLPWDSFISESVPWRRFTYCTREVAAKAAGKKKHQQARASSVLWSGYFVFIEIDLALGTGKSLGWNLTFESRQLSRLHWIGGTTFGSCRMSLEKPIFSPFTIVGKTDLAQHVSDA